MIGKNDKIIGLLMVGVLASVMTFTPVAAADWPIFHQNIGHTGFLIQPGDFSPTIWNFNAGDIIQSSPAIKDKIIFFGSHNGIIYAVNMEDSTKTWEYKTEGPVISSPTLVNDTLYIGSSDGNIYALNTANGELKWKYETGGAVESTPSVIMVRYTWVQMIKTSTP